MVKELWGKDFSANITKHLNLEKKVITKSKIIHYWYLFLTQVREEFMKNQVKPFLPDLKIDSNLIFL